MDPNVTIRPWLLACGKRYGINEAFYLRWPDESSRPETMFFTYRFLGMTSKQPVSYNLNSGSGYSATYKTEQPWMTSVRVDLYNSQDGLYELASCCAGLDGIEILKRIFSSKGIGGFELVELEDDTDFDADEIMYHQHMVLSFNENVSLALTFDNEVVEEINFNLIINGAEE